MLSRLLHGLLPVAGAVLAVSMVSFALVAFLPGDLALIMLGDSATPELLAAARQQLGLDRPLYERYLPWLGGGVSGGIRPLRNCWRLPASNSAWTDRCTSAICSGWGGRFRATSGVPCVRVNRCSMRSGRGCRSPSN